MLTITVPLSEWIDEATGKFMTEGFDLQFEHSLASLSKWESEFQEPFLNDKEKDPVKSLFYMKECMLLTENFPEGIFQKLSQKNVEDIQNYITDKRSATWFNEQKGRPAGGSSRQIVTSAVIYGWMVHLRIPFETQYWHLNALFDLIKVCNEQQKPAKKMGRAEAARQQASLNAQRQAQYRTRG